MNIKRFFFITIFLLTLLACVVPGLSAGSTPVITTTADNRLQIMVVETVAAAITQTAQAIPPTFTATVVPTFTPQPTSTPTALPVGSLLTLQENGSTLFTDERAGYTVIIPESWQTVRIKEQEFFDALTTAELSDPLIYEAFTKIRDENPNILRLFAVDIQDETIQGEPVTSLKFIWDEKQTLSFSSNEQIQALADALPKTTAGLEVTSVDIVITPSKMQFGVIESETVGSDGMMLMQKHIFFNVRNGTINAVLTTGKSLKENIVPAFDAIMDTINLLN